MFQPLANGKASGKYVVFADGFAGGHLDPGQAAHRPSGVATGPDGSLYIADDQHGRIWRVTFHGEKTVGIEPAPAPAKSAEAPAPGNTAQAQPPEGVHPDAGADVTGSLPTPPGQTPQQVALGEEIFHGEKGGTCAGCHGANAKGSPLAPDLTNGKWRWGDGSIPSIAATITNGVPHPKDYRSGMPPMGGAQLMPTDVLALADYIWSLNHPNGG